MKESGESKGRLLIIDADLKSLLFLSNVCQTLGFVTLTAQNAETALQMKEKFSGGIQVVIFDPAMPGHDETANFQSVREHFKDAVFILSVSEEQKRRYGKMEAPYFLQKPYSMDELTACLLAAAGEFETTETETLPDLNMRPSARILLVDDEAEACELIAELLYEDFPDNDFKIKWAQTGEQALELAKEFKPDIAVVDMKMPEMSGDELIQRFKAGESHCPKDFIIYTGVGDPETIQKARSLGHNVLTKPSSLDDLFGALRRICIRHNLFSKK